jgi:hypothetical protein
MTASPVTAPAPRPAVARADAAVKDAVQVVWSSQRAIPAAADRRAAAVAAAQHAIEAAVATERAEQLAAQADLRAGLRRLAAAGLGDAEIALLCGSAATGNMAGGGPGGVRQDIGPRLEPDAGVPAGCRESPPGTVRHGGRPCPQRPRGGRRKWASNGRHRH